MGEFTAPYYALLRDQQGRVVPHGKLSFFQPGTTVPKNVYADEWNSVPLTQPVIADHFGRLPRIFLEGEYKVVAEDHCGNVISGYPFDPVSSDNRIRKYTSAQVAEQVIPDCVLFWITNRDPRELWIGDGETPGGVRIFPAVTFATIDEAAQGVSTDTAISPATLAAILARCADDATPDQVAALNGDTRVEICLPPDTSDTDCPCDDDGTPMGTRVSVRLSDLIAAAGDGQGLPDCPDNLTTPMLSCVDGVPAWIEAPVSGGGGGSGLTIEQIREQLCDGLTDGNEATQTGKALTCLTDGSLVLGANFGAGSSS